MTVLCVYIFKKQRHYGYFILHPTFYVWFGFGYGILRFLNLCHFCLLLALYIIIQYLYISLSIYHLSLVWSLPLHLALTVPRLTHNLLHIIPGHSSAVKDTPVSSSATGVCHGGHHLHGGSCPGRLWRRCSCSRPAGTRWLCHRRRVSFPVAATPRNRHNLTPVNPNNSSDICSKPIRLNINQNVK